MDSRLCHKYHHDCFDEMDAFNPASIAAEWSRESSFRQGLKHHSNGLLKRFNFKGDGIPKVIICEVDVDESHQRTNPRLLSSDSSSGTRRQTKSLLSDDLTESVRISSPESLRGCSNSESTAAFSSIRSSSFSDVSNHRSDEQGPLQIDENRRENPGLADNVWSDPVGSTQTEQEWGMSSRSSRTHESAPGLLESLSISEEGTKLSHHNFVHSLRSKIPVNESLKVSERPKRNNRNTKSKSNDLTSKTVTTKRRSCKSLENPRMTDLGSSMNVLNMAIREDGTVRNNSKYMDTLFGVPGKKSVLLMASPGMHLSRSQPCPHLQTLEMTKRYYGVSYLDTLFGSEGQNGKR